MKTIKNLTKGSMIALLTLSIRVLSSCDKDNDPLVAPDTANIDKVTFGKYGNNGPVFIQKDQMARPAINTVFVPSDKKDEFNVTIPSEMGAVFSQTFINTLLNFGYTTNILGLDAAGFAGVLATDVLNVNLNAASAFGALNGRTLADDVIDTELTLIFGGADGTANPGLTSDGVDANDKAFLPYFPYLANLH